MVNTGRAMLFHELLRVTRKAPNVMVVSAVTRALLLADQGRISPLSTGGGSIRMSNEELLEFFDTHANIVESVHAGTNAMNQLPNRASITALSTAHYMFTAIDAEACDRFYLALRQGDMPDIRRFFNQNSQLKPPYRAVLQLAALTKQWNSFRSGTPLHWGTAKWIPTREEWPVPQ